MPHDRDENAQADPRWLARLSGEIAAAVAASPDRDAFPAEAFALLRRHGLSERPPVASGSGLSLLRLLAAVGRGDLAVGRLFEGHVNAVDLIRRFGSARVRSEVGAQLADGALLGVWNTDARGDPLRLEGGRLAGKKNFASGVDGLSSAIVTVPEPAGRQMFLVRLADAAVDRSWWRPLGMAASGSHIVDFSGLPPEAITPLGEPGDYIAEPWFSGGAIRFAAVHVGGMEAVMDAAVEHLTKTGRAEDPHQAHRIGRMGLAVASGNLWLREAAEAWDAAEAAAGADPEASRLRATANGFRSLVEHSAMSVLEEAERAVGAAGFNAPHRLERLIPDLRTYLRQPNPDGALTAYAKALVAGETGAGGSGIGR